jgi:hypothetical protein
MHQKIDEPIEVEVVFLKSRIIPRSFSWRSIIYRIKNLGLVHDTFIGREKVYYFSVSDGVNFFRLRLNTNSLQWRLEEMYNES